MYPFNSIIAQQEYERLNDVSKDFARGRLLARSAGSTYPNVITLARELWAAVLSLRLQFRRARSARPLADRV